MEVADTGELYEEAHIKHEKQIVMEAEGDDEARRDASAKHLSATP